MQAVAGPLASYIPARAGVSGKVVTPKLVPSVKVPVPPSAALPQKLVHTNVSALARECGVSQQSITYHLQKGKTPDQIRAHMKRAGKVGVPTSQALYQPTPKVVPQPSAEDVETEKEGETEYAARRRKEIALANKQELEVAQRMGELVPRVQVNQFIAGQIIRARDEFLKIGPEKQDALAAEGDAAKCGRIITEAVRRALDMMAEYG